MVLAVKHNASHRVVFGMAQSNKGCGYTNFCGEFLRRSLAITLDDIIISVIAALEPVVAETAARAAASGLDDLGSATVASELLSMRHQDWVVKIDYRNGGGNGDILWRMGVDGDFQIASSSVYQCGRPRRPGATGSSTPASVQ